jgi:hypothetical protein
MINFIPALPFHSRGRTLPAEFQDAVPRPDKRRTGKAIILDRHQRTIACNDSRYRRFCCAP